MTFDEWLTTEDGRMVSYLKSRDMCRVSFEAGQRNSTRIPEDLDVKLAEFTEATGDILAVIFVHPIILSLIGKNRYNRLRRAMKAILDKR